MIIFHVLKVRTDDGDKEAPHLGSGDIHRLQELFPDNPVWEGVQDNAINVNVDQARTLYDAMASCYSRNEVSAEPYNNEPLEQKFDITGNLLSVFDDLIGFFEDVLGFRPDEEISVAIRRKQEERQRFLEDEERKFRKAVRSHFEELGTLQPPSSQEIREKLEGKLDTYRQRMGGILLPPDLAIRVNQTYRDSHYKIVVCEAVLEANRGVSLVDLAVSELEENGVDSFEPQRFSDACCVISVYLGTPIAEAELV